MLSKKIANIVPNNPKELQAKAGAVSSIMTKPSKLDADTMAKTGAIVSDTIKQALDMMNSKQAKHTVETIDEIVGSLMGPQGNESVNIQHSFRNQGFYRRSDRGRNFWFQRNDRSFCDECPGRR